LHQRVGRHQSRIRGVGIGDDLLDPLGQPLLTGDDAALAGEGRGGGDVELHWGPQRRSMVTPSRADRASSRARASASSRAWAAMKATVASIRKSSWAGSALPGRL